MLLSTSRLCTGLALVVGLALSALTPLQRARAATAGMEWDRSPDLSASPDALRRGARTFVNYCMGCHSAQFVRYTKLRDLGLSDQQIEENLIVNNVRIGDTMRAALSPQDAKAWLGKNPPDLSLVARSRAGHGGTGPDYLYTFLRGFYADPSKTTGWNNTALPDVAMPNPLWNLQGSRQIQGKVTPGHVPTLSPAIGGSMSEQQFDSTIADLVAFMTWLGEPDKAKHQTTGVVVMLYLLLLAVLAWRLNREFWKDVK